MLVPVAAIGLALGGAFMTSAAKANAADDAQVPGYYFFLESPPFFPPSYPSVSNP